MKDDKLIDLSQCDTCPKGYPWTCWVCKRHNQGCSGRDKKED